MEFCEAVDYHYTPQDVWSMSVYDFGLWLTKQELKNKLRTKHNNGERPKI